MKIRREYILGVVGILSLLLFVWGINYLKGKDLLLKQQRFYVVYPKIDGLIESHPVTVNGVNVGQVNKISFHHDRSGKVVVECIIGDLIDIPVNSVAMLTSSSLIGGYEIELLLGDESRIIQNRDTLNGEIKPDLQEEIASLILPIKEQASSILIRMDTLVTSLNELFKPETRNQINTGLNHLNTTLSHVEAFTKHLREQEKDIAHIIDNFVTVSDSLAALELGATMEQARSTIESLSQLVNEINESEGTAGLLLHDPDLYNNLESASKQLELLLEDVKNNPRKYFSISIFGKK